MPITPTYPGVYIEELPSGVRPILGVATSITAFVGYAPIGPEHTPVRLASFGEYERRFGGIDRESEMSYAVRQFFLNGGTDAIVVRVPKSDAERASIALEAGIADGADTSLTLEAISSGAWGNRVVVDVDHAGVADDRFNLTVTELVSGTTERFVDLSTADDSPRFAVAILNDADSGSRLVRAIAGDDGADRPAVAGTQGAAVDFDGVDATKNYDLVIQPDQPRIPDPNDANETIEAVDELTVRAISVGERVPTTISGLAAMLERKINLALADADGAAGLAVSVGPNAAGDGLRVTAATDPDVAPTAIDAAFTITSATPGGDVEDGALLLGFHTDDGQGNEADAEANVGRYTAAGTARLAQGDLTPGSDGTTLPETGDLIGSAADFTGLFALERVDLFNLLVIADATRTAPGQPTTLAANLDSDAVWSTALDLCRRHRAMLLIDPPPSAVDAERALDWIEDLGTKGPNATAHFPRVRIPDPADDFRPRTVAPSGTLAGLYARTDAERGVWKAPAGTDARLGGLAGLTTVLNDAENGRLNPLGLNCLRTFPVVGTVNWGARTTDGADVLASQWKYVPVRRLALMIEESVFRGTQWAVFEPNDEPLWSQLRLNLTAFMQNLFRQGAFAGGTAREAYLVKCDSETTTRDDVDRGVVNVLVGFAPLKPAEFVVIRIQQLAGQTAS